MMASQSAADVELRLALERFLTEARGTAVRVLAWRRERSPFAVRGIFPIDVLRVSLHGGPEIALFVKQVGAEQADHPDKQCREREVRVYQELLHEEGLPAPRCYGSRWNARTSRRELYLEYVADWSLKYQGLDSWFPAARRLAQLHAHFARRAATLRACDCLLRLDAPYFHAWAARAHAAVAGQDAALASELAPLVADYDHVAHTLAAQPPTLVHNDLAPKNVIADRSRQPARICFVDWELAGVGCGLLDLVHLKHGLDPASDAALCAAYCDELGGTGLLPASERERRRVFASCEVHLTLVRLAHSRSWSLPPGRIAQWVADARAAGTEASS